MNNPIQFVESFAKNSFNCAHCKRNIKENEKFYRVIFAEKELMLICELCKGGYLAFIREGIEKTYTTHFSYFTKKELQDTIGIERLPDHVKKQLFEAIEDYDKDKVLESLRSLGNVGEWLTNRIYENYFGKGQLKKQWHNKLTELSSHPEIIKEDFPTKVCIHLLWSLKDLRNLVSHPDSEYIEIGLNFKSLAEDVRIAIMIIIYCIPRLSIYF